jgi:phosphatidylglycerol:prolipoprotein diacylglycerol transferase
LAKIDQLPYPRAPPLSRRAHCTGLCALLQSPPLPWRGMAPDLFEFAGITVRGYGLAIGIGILLMTWVVQHESARIALPRLGEVWVVILIALVAAAFVGGKLAWWLGDPPRARAVLAQQGWGVFLREGFVFYGSLLLCVPTGWLVLRAFRLPVARSLDVIFLALPLLHAAGRIGCVLAGCCYGCATEGPLGITFRNGRGLNGVPLLPVQLLEAAAELGVFAWLWFRLRPRQRYEGEIVLVWIVLYALVRIPIEALRGDGNPVLLPWRAGQHQPGMAPLGLTLSQAIALLLLLVALPLHLRLRSRARSGG